MNLPSLLMRSATRRLRPSNFSAGRITWKVYSISASHWQQLNLVPIHFIEKRSISLTQWNSWSLNPPPSLATTCTLWTPCKEQFKICKCNLCTFEEEKDICLGQLLKLYLDNVDHLKSTNIESPRVNWSCQYEFINQTFIKERTRQILGPQSEMLLWGLLQAIPSSRQLLPIIREEDDVNNV